MDGGAWRATSVHGVTESDTTERLHFIFSFFLSISLFETEGMKMKEGCFLLFFMVKEEP